MEIYLSLICFRQGMAEFNVVFWNVWCKVMSNKLKFLEWSFQSLDLLIQQNFIRNLQDTLKNRREFDWINSQSVGDKCGKFKIKNFLTHTIIYSKNSTFASTLQCQPYLSLFATKIIQESFTISRCDLKLSSKVWATFNINSIQSEVIILNCTCCSTAMDLNQAWVWFGRNGIVKCNSGEQYCIPWDCYHLAQKNCNWNNSN